MSSEPLLPDASEAHEQLLAGWGRTAPTRARVLRPRTSMEALQALRIGSPRGVLARGLGRSYGDAAQNAGGTVLRTVHLDTRLDLDATTGRAWVSAGMSLGRLIEEALPHGWFPAVNPGTQFVSVGGAVASDVHGKNHHRDGSFCAHVRALELGLPNGERVILGPEGDTADFFWATAGGMGLTGVILSAELQMQPVQTAKVRVALSRTRDLEHTMHALSEADESAHYTVAWLDLLCAGSSRGRGVVSAGDHVLRADLAPERSGLSISRGRRLPSVPALPNRRGILTPGAMRLFNDLYYRAAPHQPSIRVEPVQRFFFPLDLVGDWNRLYGRAGMLQYQFVIPDRAQGDLARMVDRLSADGIPVYLAVLKRLGNACGPLGFPLRGWTLTMDIPACTPGLAGALDRLDQSVADAGGRVYLAKDARLRAALLPTMYPRLEEWRAVRNTIDPEHTMRSDLDRRLSLIGAEAVRGDD